MLKLRYVAMLVAMLALAACGRRDEPQPANPEVGRAVLVYMVANNNLGSSKVDDSSIAGFDNADIREMEQAARAGAFGKNRLLIYHHPYGGVPELKEVTSGGLKVICSYDTQENSCTSARMNRVIADFHRLAPSRKSGIIFWSHGTGWLQTGLKETPSVSAKWFGLDGSTKMNITTLASVLDKKGFDYIYFDCCHMTTVEVAYELRNAAEKIVGSVSELPSLGMPYHITLPFLMADEADLEGAANATFSHYNALTGEDRTCTMSVIRTDRLPALAAAIKALYGVHPTLPRDYAPQKFIKYECYYYDLEHYLRALASESPQAAALLPAALSALREAVTYKGATPYLWQGYYDYWGRLCEVKIDAHCGLSTFILQYASDAPTRGYNELSWYTDVASSLF